MAGTPTYITLDAHGVQRTASYHGTPATRLSVRLPPGPPGSPRGEHRQLAAPAPILQPSARAVALGDARAGPGAARGRAAPRDRRHARADAPLRFELPARLRCGALAMGAD